VIAAFWALVALAPAGPEYPFAGLDAAGLTVIEAARTEGCAEAEVWYPSDGLRVRAFVFVPETGGPHPLIVFNHGGVSGVSADMKWRSRQLARAGYAVIAPAYRGEGGSEGVIEIAQGEVDDVIAAASLMAGWSRVDAKRVGLAGSSHGALISVLAAAREPDRFACVAAACGVMDVVSWYRYLVANDFDVSDSLSVAVYGAGPDDRPESFRIRRAVLVAGDVTAPVLLQQGKADRTVPPDQARAMRDALLAAGHEDVTLIEYPLLGHAFWFWNDPKYHTPVEIRQTEDSWRTLVRFLDRHLKTPGQAPARGGR